MIKILIFVIAAEVLTAVGQVLFKKSTNSIGLHSLRGTGALINFVKTVLSKPMIWVGLVSMVIGLIVWLAALAQADLSIVFSLGSIQYVMILFFAHFLLDEKVDMMKLSGTIFVIIGIILITIS